MRVCMCISEHATCAHVCMSVCVCDCVCAHEFACMCVCGCVWMCASTQSLGRAVAASAHVSEMCPS